MFFGAACSDCRHTGFVPFERLVRDGDRIKFAGGVASRDDCDRALESACTFVSMTIPPAKEEVA